MQPTTVSAETPLLRFPPLVLAFMLSAACFGGEESAPGNRIDVEFAGVRVMHSEPLAEHVIWPAGTTLLLKVSSPAGDFIRFDDTDSVIAKFVDEQGTDLRAKPAGSAGKTLAGFGHSPKISDDAKTCLIEVNAPATPAKGSKTVSLSGTVSMLCATRKQETVLEHIELKNGARLKGPGTLELDIEQTGKPEWGAAPFGFLLRAQRELDDLAELKFFRPDGSEIKSTRTATSTMVVFGAVKVEWTYTLSEEVKTATVKLYTWADVKKKRAQFDLKADLGL